MNDMAERSSPQWRKYHDLEVGEYGTFHICGRGVNKAQTLYNDPELKADLPEDTPSEILPPGTLWFGPLPEIPPELLAWSHSELDAESSAESDAATPGALAVRIRPTQD